MQQSISKNDEHIRPEGVSDEPLQASANSRKRSRRSSGHAERYIRNELMAGRRHIYESEMKEQNHTPEMPGHEARP